MHIPTRLMGSHERVNVAARRRSFILSIAAPTLAITTTVTADYQGLQVQLHTSTVLGGASRDVYRVYAMFSDPEDYVNGVFGSPTLGNMTIRTLSSTGTPPGGSFVNVNAPGGGGATAPQAGAIVANPPLQWDTFVTIGLAVVPSGVTDVTTLSPGFTGIGNVPALDTNNAGWFLLGSGITQGSAGNGIVFAPGLWGVIIMQLTVNGGNHVAGTVGVQGRNNTSLAGGSNFVATSQTFNSFPGPGGLAVLGMAAMCGWRRRREMNCKGVCRPLR
jgi:hypothetical protein